MERSTATSGANVQGQLYFSYNGVAMINNARGARFAGYFHHPRSNEGCYVSAAEK